MGLYRARDLLLAPNLLSLSRLPLALAFAALASRPPIAFAILSVAGLTDVLDGFVARSRSEVTATGAVIDPITDKLFVAVVMITLILDGKLAPSSVLLLAARELGEAPLVLWWAVSRTARRARTEAPKANVPGKLATGLQFLAVSLALFESPLVVPALYVACGAGVVAACIYWIRDLGARPPK